MKKPPLDLLHDFEHRHVHEWKTIDLTPIGATRYRLIDVCDCGERCGPEYDGRYVTAVLEDALRDAIGDYLESEGAPREGPGAEEAFRLYVTRAARSDGTAA